MLLLLLSGSQARDDLILTAPERGYTLGAGKRAFRLAGPARPYGLSADARNLTLTSPERDYSLTGQEH